MSSRSLARRCGSSRYATTFRRNNTGGGTTFTLSPGVISISTACGKTWSKPAKLVLEELRVVDNVSTLEVRALDARGVLCLDARNFVRFAVAGDGRLIDNLGTSTTARKVELYNGRAQISVQRKGKLVVSVSSEGLPTAFLNI